MKEKKGLFRTKRIKKLEKKVHKARKESTKARMLFLFELEKELEEDYNIRENKYDKHLTQWIYKNFEKIYP